MLRTLLKSKIHRATVSHADLEYEGSISIDRDLMDAADLLPHERVDIYDITNGARLATYVIEAERGSGYVQMETAEARDHQPRICFVDSRNRLR